MPEDAEDIIAGLCTRDLSRRLGHVRGGAQRLKSHPFYRGIDWDAIYHRRFPGPIVPELKHAGDCSNFDDYAPEAEDREPYTLEMQEMYEEDFAAF